MQRLIDLLSRVARLAFWPAFVFALVMAVLPKPPSLPIDNLGDKFAHMLAFFTLSLSLAWAGRGHRCCVPRCGFRLSGPASKWCS